jgi:serine/threonine protein kinase
MTGSFNEDFTRLIVTQVGLIINQFHKEGYIYRDIKASNFMINQNGKISMIDLGKAKLLNNQKTFTICGTTHSMPPEVFEGKGYSFSFDYYSFGILIYELLTGSVPFGYHQHFDIEYYNLVKEGVSEEKLDCIKD